MNGKSQVKTISKVLQTNTLSKSLEIILLFGLGMLAIFLHARLRIPLKLPGHHGIEFMALIIAGRSMSKMPVASSISALGVASLVFIPGLGFKDPFMALVFAIPCIAVDLYFNAFKNKNSKIIILAIIAGLSYMMIPLLRFIIELFTGIVYGSLLAGLAYPLFTHIAFGFVGGFLGAGIIKGVKNKRKKE
jgi:hypothetical protein